MKHARTTRVLRDILGSGMVATLHRVADAVHRSIGRHCGWRRQVIVRGPSALAAMGPDARWLACRIARVALTPAAGPQIRMSGQPGQRRLPMLNTMSLSTTFGEMPDDVHTDDLAIAGVAAVAVEAAHRPLA